MAKLNLAQQLAKPILPFSPTVDANNDPTVCCACGRCSIGVGVGWITWNDPKTKDPMFLCQICIVSSGDLTKMQRLNHYELKALHTGLEAWLTYYKSFGLTAPSVLDNRAALNAGMEAGGAWLEEKGITDLSEMEPDDILRFVRAVWGGCATGAATPEAQDELTQLMAVKEIWAGCARGVREALKEAPF